MSRIGPLILESANLRGLALYLSFSGTTLCHQQGDLRREKKGELVEGGQEFEGAKKKKKMESIEERIHEVFIMRFPWKNEYIKDVQWSKNISDIMFKFGNDLSVKRYIWWCLYWLPLFWILGWGAMLSHFSRVWLFATLWTVAPAGSSVCGFSRQEYWNGLPFPSPRNLPDLASLRSPALAGGFLYH